MNTNYKPPVVGEVRGPIRTSPGNALPWLAYCYGPGGWVPFHAKTGAEALKAAQAHAATLGERIKVYDRTFAVVAKFDNDKAANDYMEDHPEVGLIAIENGWRYLANLNDKGVRA